VFCDRLSYSSGSSQEGPVDLVETVVKGFEVVYRVMRHHMYQKMWLCVRMKVVVQRMNLQFFFVCPCEWG